MANIQERIVVKRGWADLHLPDATRAALRGVSRDLNDTRQRPRDRARDSAQPRGSLILFAGPNHDQKRVAAEAVAGELRLDLLRIDLARVVAKSIGDTEKALRALFDRSEDAGAVLLLDEADALFGKRSEVKDSHDRYANVAVSLLMLLLEAHRSIAILSTREPEIEPSLEHRLLSVVHFT
jgi:SpoVK/Ycf46/Vps4 family AAA+-type ATPase